MKCPACGKDPCIKMLFLNRVPDSYRNACEEGMVMCPQCGSEGHARIGFELQPCPLCEGEAK